jgi:hypothetical protein
VRQPEKELQHLEWVRSTKGAYVGDLALVWYPIKDGKIWDVCANTNQNVVTVLVVPREGGGRIQAIDGGDVIDNNTARQLPRRREPSAEEIADKAKGSEYSKKYFNGLLITRFDVRHTERTTPREEELSPFAESNFDVRLWRRFLAQQRLQNGQKVEIVGSEHNGRSAIFLGSVNRTAKVMLCARSSLEEDAYIDVDLRTLDPRFEAGDVVRTVPSYSGARIRSGIVARVDDWRVIDAEQVKREREAFESWYRRRSRMPAVAWGDRNTATLDPIVVWPADDVDLNGVAKIDVHILDPKCGEGVGTCTQIQGICSLSTVRCRSSGVNTDPEGRR